jgi:hypothetical protein
MKPCQALADTVLAPLSDLLLGIDVPKYSVSFTIACSPGAQRFVAASGGDDTAGDAEAAAGAVPGTLTAAVVVVGVGARAGVSEGKLSQAASASAAAIVRRRWGWTIPQSTSAVLPQVRCGACEPPTMRGPISALAGVANAAGGRFGVFAVALWLVLITPNRIARVG